MIHINREVDNLHYFEDIHAKKYQAGSRLLHLILQAKKAFVEYPKVVWVAVLSFTVFAFYLCSFGAARLSGPGMLLLFITMFQATFLLGFFVLAHLALYLSKLFSIKLYLGFRDACFFTMPLLLFGLYFIVKIHLFIFLAVLISEAVLIFIYRVKVAPRKQHDLDIPKLLDADPIQDLEILGEVEFKKRQIRGDTRNCMLVRKNKPLEFKLRQKATGLKFAVGIPETVESYGDGIKVSVYLKDSSGKEPALLFKKVLYPKNHYEEREWLEISINPDWDRIDFNAHIFLVKTEDMEKVNLSDNSGVYISEFRHRQGEGSPNKIIFVVFDAVRHDHIGCYGYKRNISPNVDSFSKDAVMFKHAMVQGEWTLTSFMSFLTSLYPSSHGVFHPTHYQHLHPKITTLPQVLRENGFITRAYFTHKRLVSNFGFARGLDSHVYRQCDKENKVGSSDDVLGYAVDMLDLHKDDDLFLMLHFFDTHQACYARSPYSDIFDKTYDKPILKDVRRRLLMDKDYPFTERDIENLIARYDSEIYRQDKRFGLLIDHLKSTGQYDQAMIIFVADHGMLLNDHKDLTAIKPFDETLRVPLIIKFPKKYSLPSGVKIEEIIAEANIDIMPTILDCYNIGMPSQVQGRSLLPFGMGKKDEGSDDGFAVSESFYDKSYTVSVRGMGHRYTAKAAFDFSTISSLRFHEPVEEFFKVEAANPEMLIKDGKDKSLEYRNRVFEHVAKAKELNLNLHRK